jgi:hypothetical protein
MPVVASCNERGLDGGVQGGSEEVLENVPLDEQPVVLQGVAGFRAGVERATTGG